MVLSEKDKSFIKNKLSKELTKKVRIINFTQEIECEYCKVTRELIEELASLNDLIEYEIYDFEKDQDMVKKYKIDKIPATLILGEKNFWVRYFGMPSGYEFAAFLEDIIDASKGTTRLSPTTKEKLKEIKTPIHIQVFVTPTCPYCPRAVRLAHQFAMENEYIVADMIESLEFPHLAIKYGVMAVPKVVINESISFEGALPEPHFLEYVLIAAKRGSQTYYL